MHNTIVCLLVGLSPDLLGEHTPNLSAFAERGHSQPIASEVVPAVTCSVQSTYLTGLLPNDHGIVGNGWYFRDLAEIWFWRQANALVKGEMLWDKARQRDTNFSCANLFWWYNMYSGADIGVTPRPMYPIDGRKIPDVYTKPATLRDELQGRFGPFPLFHFWGPAADIRSSAWIKSATLYIHEQYSPTLTLSYLPHLDYALQRFGPDGAEAHLALRELDELCGEIIDYAEEKSSRLVFLSEYGINTVNQAIPINRLLRQYGWLSIRDELGTEKLDPGASAAFAVADHQLAHIYVANPNLCSKVQAALTAVPGIEAVWDRAEQSRAGLNHTRSGELVALTQPNAWFSYDYWLDEQRAPDFARTVDIHRKPGYDPLELFIDPEIKWPKVHIAWNLIKRKFGKIDPMRLISLDTSLVKGSHGRPADQTDRGPIILSSHPYRLASTTAALPATQVRDSLLSVIFDLATE